MLRRVAGCLSLGLRRVNVIAPASTTFTHLPPTISKPVHDWSSDANSDTKLPQACFNIFRVAGIVVGLSLSLGLGFKAHCSPGYTVDEATLKKYGRYPPWCRLNVDQVPLPFVNDMDVTYAERGSKRVNINQLGPSLGKRQATGQLCFRPMVPPRSGCTHDEARQLYDNYLQQQPAPCIIFRGQGNISDLELGAYPEGLVVLWRAKAWVDRPVAMEWAEDVVKPFY